MKYVDDSLDVFICHGCGGGLGAILCGWFSSTDANPVAANGVLYGGGKLLGWQVRFSFFVITEVELTVLQIIACLMTIAISVVGTSVILLFIRYVFYPDLSIRLTSVVGLLSAFDTHGRRKTRVLI